MSATRFPTIAELQEVWFVGPIVCNLLDALGLTDADMPDIVPDDLDWDDEDAVKRCFPTAFAKLEGLA